MVLLGSICAFIKCLFFFIFWVSSAVAVGANVLEDVKKILNMNVVNHFSGSSGSRTLGKKSQH